MTIWLLALILLASLAGLGYRQGAIRVAFSLVGIVVGALLAVPLGRLVGRVLTPLGVKDPLLAWVLGPLLVFVIISAAFKMAAAAVHHKVDMHYKYHAGDLRLALWERLNHRLGLCLGLVNGTAYFILLAFVISVPSYLTVQVATSDQDPKWMRLVDQMGRDLHSTGFIKTARAINSIPQLDYDMADFVALLYRNSLLEARLRLYPGLLALADRPEFQQLGSDRTFTESWQRLDPVMTLYNYPGIQAIRRNPELLKVIWNTLAPDLPDLRAYLASGKSAKYDGQPILGRWYLDINLCMHAVRRAKPNMPASEMQKWKAWMMATYSKVGLIARPDNKVIIKNLPQITLATSGNLPGSPETLQGEWKDLDGGKYVLSFPDQDLEATVEGDRLATKHGKVNLVFSREN